MAQLEKIEVIVEWRWVLKESPCDHREESEVGEEDGDNEEGSKDGLRESQEERTSLSASY